MKSSYNKIIIALIILIGLVWLATPNYLRNSLVYWYANLDDYTIFENDDVNIGDVQEWNISGKYNKKELSEFDRQYLVDRETVGFLVIQNDSIVYEEYWDGYNSQSHSNIFSATKSIVSLLIGVAIDEGKINSVDDKISLYIPEYKNIKKGEITIKNLLNMSSGLSWNETYANPLSITTKSYYGEKLREVSLDQSIVAEQGVEFRYQSGNTQILSFIVEQATGITISKYAEQKLWKPMGAKEPALWSLDKKDGDEKAFCCFNTNIRDAARFGKLVLQKGKWNNNQLVSEAYMTEATTAASYLKDGDKQVDFYAYQWWILPYNGVSIPYMRGHRGQYIYTLAEQNAVVVRFGKSKDPIKKGQITLDIPKYVDIALRILEN